LIPESDASQSSDSRRPGSPENAVISDVSDESIPKTLPSHCMPLLPFTEYAGLNTDIENADVMSFVKLFITNNFLEYVCAQTNLRASQVISAPTHPFTKYSLQ
jgi:hypothetical protein